MSLKSSIAIASCCGLALLAAPSVTLAQTAAPAASAAPAAAAIPFKLAIVDIDGVRSQSTAFKKASEQFVKFSEDMNAALQKEDQTLRDANAELVRKRTTVTPEVFEDERKKLEKRVTDFQRKVQERQQALNQSQSNALNQINSKIAEIVTQYAEQNKVSLVLPEQYTVLVAKSLKIDAYVLERLNKELPSVPVTMPK